MNNSVLRIGYGCSTRKQRFPNPYLDQGACQRMRQSIEPARIFRTPLTRSLPKGFLGNWAATDSPLMHSINWLKDRTQKVGIKSQFLPTEWRWGHSPNLAERCARAGGVENIHKLCRTHENSTVTKTADETRLTAKTLCRTCSYQEKVGKWQRSFNCR